MSINTFELASQISFQFCQIPLLKNHPTVIHEIKIECDKLINELYQYLDSNNLTFNELDLEDNDYENNDLLFIMNNGEYVYNIFLKCFCGAVDDFLEKSNNGNQEMAEYYISNFSDALQLFILKFVKTSVRTTCFGCLTNQPNQQAHMDENGCMWQSMNMFENMSM